MPCGSGSGGWTVSGCAKPPWRSSLRARTVSLPEPMIRRPLICEKCAEALGTEAEHRVLARFAASVLGAPTSPPNNVGFEPFPYKSTNEVVQALTGLGIGYGTPGAMGRVLSGLRSSPRIKK